MSHPSSHDEHAHSHESHESEIPHFQEHEESLEEEVPPILSAGIINDLGSRVWENTIDVSHFFHFGDPVAVDHNSSHWFNDIQKYQGETAIPPIRLSRRLSIRISHPHSKEFLDLYRTSDFTSPLFSFTKKAVQVRMARISLYRDLPVLPENSIDIRELLSHPPSALHPDIYELEKTLARRARHIRIKHGKRIVRIGWVICLGGILCIGVLGGLGYIAKVQTLRAYEKLSILPSTQSQIPQKTGEIREHFLIAKASFFPIHGLITAGLVSNESLLNADHAIEGWLALMDAAEKIDILRTFLAQNLPSSFTGELSYLDPRLLTHTSANITGYIKENSEMLSALQDSIAVAQFHYASISSTGDTKKDEELRKISQILGLVDSSFRYISHNREHLLTLFGDRKPMNYLILNQNRDELRANGWFPGSAIELTFYKGRLEKYEKKDIYFYDWHLFPYGETPPPGINQITKVFGLRDANYYPDFSQTFTTVSRMYERAGGSTLDWLIAINQGVVEKILQVIEPVTVPKIKEPLRADSFSLVLSVLVEGQYGRQSSAKDILFTAIEAIEKRMVEVGAFDTYAKILQDEVAAKQILAAFRDEWANAFAKNIFWDVPYRNNPDNFVYPVFTSLSGNKSDRYMNRAFTLTSLGGSGCTFTNRFEMESTHTFTVSEREKMRKMLYDYGIDPKTHEHELFVQGNGDNVQFMRIILPKGSRITRTLSGSVSPIALDTAASEYDAATFTVTTPVAWVTRAAFEYTSTPSSCEKEIVFIPQPGLARYRVR